MKVKDYINLTYLTGGVIPRVVLPVLSLLLVLAANYMVFCVAPAEQVMGAVQKIFYFHVGAALASYLMIGFLLVGSVVYLVRREREWDLMAEAAAGVGFLLCSMVLVSGMIWGHSAWNTWWRWEPRLVSFLVLWLILFSYLLLRSYTAGDYRQAGFAAVLGIISAVNVPIVMFSIKFVSHAEQLHPEVVAQQGLRDSRYVYALIVAICAVCVFALWLWVVKLTQLLLRETLTELEIGKES